MTTCGLKQLLVPAYMKCLLFRVPILTIDASGRLSLNTQMMLIFNTKTTQLFVETNHEICICLLHGAMLIQL